MNFLAPRKFTWRVDSADGSILLISTLVNNTLDDGNNVKIYIDINTASSRGITRVDIEQALIAQ